MKNNLFFEILEESKNNTFPFILREEITGTEKILLEITNKKIQEGLISTYNYNSVTDVLNKYGEVIPTQKGKDMGQIYLKLIEKNYNHLNHIIEVVNLSGYFVEYYMLLEKGLNPNIQSNYKEAKDLSEFIDKLDEYQQIWLIINSKFNSTINNNNNNIQLLYHLTKKSNLGKILSKGLILKSFSKKKYHPERIYVTTKKNNLKDLLYSFKKMEDTEYVVLTIDYIKADQPKLYNDPNYFELGYYLLDNIPTSSIVKVEGSEIL